MEPPPSLTAFSPNILVVSSPNRDRYKVSAQDKQSLYLPFCCSALLRVLASFGEGAMYQQYVVRDAHSEAHVVSVNCEFNVKVHLCRRCC